MIGDKIIKIMQEIGPIERTELDEENNIKTAKVEAIIGMVGPLLIKYKVAIIPKKVVSFMPQGNKVYITMQYQVMDLGDKDKDCIEVEVPASGYDKSGGRAVFAALTGAYRYVMQQCFAINIVDEIKNNGSDPKDEENENNEEEHIESEVTIQETNNEVPIDEMSMEDLDALFSYKTA